MVNTKYNFRRLAKARPAGKQICDYPLILIFGYIGSKSERFIIFVYWWQHKNDTYLEFKTKMKDMLSGFTDFNNKFIRKQPRKWLTNELTEAVKREVLEPKRKYTRATYTYHYYYIKSIEKLTITQKQVIH